MKYFIILLISISLYSNDLKWVDEQIAAIKPLRNGVKLNEIDILKDPFIYVKNSKTVKNKKNNTKKVIKSKKNIKKDTLHHFTLQAIMNSYALINGKWYKNGSKIDGYKLNILNRTKVVLIRKSKRISLSTKTKKLKLR